MIRAQVVYPLHAAARHSHIQCLQVRVGCHLAKTVPVNFLLWHSLKLCDCQILRLGGFDIDFVTDEGSALHVAAMFGQVDAVKYLTNEGITQFHARKSNK